MNGAGQRVRRGTERPRALVRVRPLNHVISLIEDGAEGVLAAGRAAVVVCGGGGSARGNLKEIECVRVACLGQFSVQPLREL